MIEKLINFLWRLKRETKHIKCDKCGKSHHLPNAKFCGNCGQKIKESFR